MREFLAQYMPVGASEHAKQVDSLNSWVHILMLVLFVVWGAYLCLSTWIHELQRARTALPTSEAAAPRQPSFERVASLVLLALLCTTLAGVA